MSEFNKNELNNEQLNKEQLNDEELKNVNGGVDISQRVSIEEPNPNDPRCSRCHFHLNYNYTEENGHYFTCSECGMRFFKSVAGAWFELKMY